MSRPSVSIVMPFAGTPAEGRVALARLAAVAVAPDDERILVDNLGVLASAEPSSPTGIVVVPAVGERSAAHARNVGAGAARGEWLLFLDADVIPSPDLVARYLAEPIPDGVGVLAGGIDGAADSRRLAARYGAARGFLDADLHLAHPYMPRAASANLLVRRAVFEALGGFVEGVRAAEDTDLCWRVQRAGWRLESRPAARVAHRYRESLGALRRQWRGYAAGRAWLARRYPDFHPEPALVRVLRRRARPPAAVAHAPAVGAPPRPRAGGRAFAILDAMLGIEELVGFLLPNRPPARAIAGPRRLLVADRFPPAAGDRRPGEPGATGGHAAPTPPADRPPAFPNPASPRPGDHVEAAARGPGPALSLPGLSIRYAEDDGLGERRLAAAALLAAHPWRCLRDRHRRAPGEPVLAAVAPAARRLRGNVPLLALESAAPVRARAERLAGLAGRQVDAIRS